MGNNINILVVEDNDDINNLICSILERNDYKVKSAYSGTEALILIQNYNYDLVLLDIMLPGLDGENVIKEIRRGKFMPIIALSAKNSRDDKINILKLGADDFLSKPFDIDELLARIGAQLRRCIEFSVNTSKNSILKHKKITLNIEKRDVSIGGETLNLTCREFSILELLMKNKSKVFTRENIFESVWNSDFIGDYNTINVHISNLRTKISKYDDQEYIQTVWGIGFKLKE